jgi:hypothetical protein
MTKKPRQSPELERPCVSGGSGYLFMKISEPGSVCQWGRWAETQFAWVKIRLPPAHNISVALNAAKSVRYISMKRERRRYPLRLSSVYGAVPIHVMAVQSIREQVFEKA